MPMDVSEEIVGCDSAPTSAPGSPKDRIKFLCSLGGKIIPRPTDGHLKYVGGETRVISIPRDIKFQELMKKLTYQMEGEMALKYQLVPEDLDALVSVKSDEDLRYMIDECERVAAGGSPRLRAFLFPAKPILLDSLNHSVEAIEQRYIDAINGIVRGGNGNNNNVAAVGLTKPPAARHSLGQNQNQNHAVFSVSSTCSSPRSPDDDAVSNHDHLMMMNGGGMLSSGKNNRMHKVQSMPSFGSLNNAQQQQQSSNGHYNAPPTTTLEHFRGVNRMVSGRAMGNPAPALQYNNNSYYAARQSRQPFSMMGGQFDDFYEKGAMSASQSPLRLSPRYGHTALRPWDAHVAPVEIPHF
nr:uncharacterized protein LOC109165864 [Ipomoea batatas]